MNTVNISAILGPVPTRPYHHGALEGALIEAALEVVRASGIADVAVRDLARTAGVSPSAAYRHFPNLDRLVSRVSQRCREELAHAMIAARDSMPPGGGPKRRSAECLRVIGRAYVRFAVEHPTVFEAAFVRCASPPDCADDPAAWSVLVEAIDDMAAAGLVPRARRAEAPLIAWAGVHGLSQILTASTWPTGVDIEPHIDAVVDAIVRSIC